ncbi:glycosyltransferase family 2 protein [Candidatus Woesearchaeota archaeon]|nr:hypothetical protein [uncultured archaeon]MBS3142071.1 glycosyltransferase family 2 protein [Candidatus Woesearchaeota archaeon]
MKKLFIIIPGLNEQKHIASVIKGAQQYSEHVVVVDDGSTDAMAKIAMESGATVLHHVINLGKGAALKTGCEYALAQGADQIVFIDSDGQHDTRDIPKFIEALKGHDIVFGYRTFNRDMPLVFRIGNILINHTARLLFGIRLRDILCGYRAFNAEVYEKIEWTVSGYSVESEIVANVGAHHLTYAEVSTKTIYDDKYKGTTVVDGIKIVLNMLAWRLRG